MVKKTDKKEELKTLLEEMLKLMGVEASVEAIDGPLRPSGRDDGSEASEEGLPAEVGAVNLSINSEDSALLIGYHGRTISALGTIMSVISYEKFGEKVPVLVDVDGWRERREETVVGIARQTAEHVKSTGQAVPIYNLTPYERRVVHTALTDDERVITESEGEGRDRHLIVKPKA